MMRYEISTEPGDVRPGDLVVFRLQTKNSVKWSCGPVRCFTDDKDAPAVVLTTGSIPEYAGYAELLHQVDTRRRATRYRGGVT